MKNGLKNGGIVILVAIATVPLINLVVMVANSFTLSWEATGSMEVLGQMGDFFGGHTASFSGLISVVLILHFSSKQNRLQQEQFEKQLLIAKQTADLTSLSNIYSHYDSVYGAKADAASILNRVAAGHRRWTIRESFSIIDPESALEPFRKSQVLEEHSKLNMLTKQDKWNDEELAKIAELTSSLLLDKRLAKHIRVRLWGLYEMLREDPVSLVDTNSNLHLRFRNYCANMDVA